MPPHENRIAIRIVMRTASPFDKSNSATSLAQGLYAPLKLSKAASTFSQASRKRFDKVECLRRGRRKPAARYCKYSASLAFAISLRSRYSELLTLGIPRVKNSLPLTVSADTTTPRSLSLETRPLIPRLRCVSPNPRSGDCKMYVNGHNYMQA